MTRNLSKLLMLNKCPICHKAIYGFVDTVWDDKTSKIEYHTRCVLWNNKRGVKETRDITHCHTRLKDGSMCKGLPIYTMLTLPQCEDCFKEGIDDFGGSIAEDIWKKQLDELGRKSSD